MSKHNQGKIGNKGGYLQEKPTFKAKTEGLEDSIFYYGKGMKENYLKVSREISEYIIHCNKIWNGRKIDNA